MFFPVRQEDAHIYTNYRRNSLGIALFQDSSAVQVKQMLKMLIYCKQTSGLISAKQTMEDSFSREKAIYIYLEEKRLNSVTIKAREKYGIRRKRTRLREVFETKR